LRCELQRGGLEATVTGGCEALRKRAWRLCESCVKQVLSSGMPSNEDVPSPIDLCRPADARAWAEAAMRRRPWRADVFAAMTEELRALPAPRLRVLELGSGPGFLAQHVVQQLGARVDYVALDVSAAMHALARERSGEHAHGVSFVERSFKAPGWSEGLGRFDAVLTVQAVHELRHKRHAPGLHAAVGRLLAPGGRYLVCDHVCGRDGLTNEALYMSLEEQVEALRAGGFVAVDLLLERHSLALLRAQAAVQALGSAGPDEVAS
jgi:SAM-dependent methyltransferase